MVVQMKTRSKEEIKQFLKEQDGWTTFETEECKLFGTKHLMSKCTKCGYVERLDRLFTYLSPLHCIGCGRTTLEQERVDLESLCVALHVALSVISH